MVPIGVRKRRLRGVSSPEEPGKREPAIVEIVSLPETPNALATATTATAATRTTQRLEAHGAGSALSGVRGHPRPTAVRVETRSKGRC